jgi:hypothetical protein
MIGTGKRYKTFGMLGGSEDTRGILNADGIVGGRMKQQERLAEIGETILNILLRTIIEEFTLDNGRPASVTSTSPCPSDFINVLLEQTGDVHRSQGAAMVTTACAYAAASAAAPPRLWPIRIAGAP